MVSAVWLQEQLVLCTSVAAVLLLSGVLHNDGMSYAHAVCVIHSVGLGLCHLQLLLVEAGCMLESAEAACLPCPVQGSDKLFCLRMAGNSDARRAVDSLRQPWKCIWALDHALCVCWQHACIKLYSWCILGLVVARLPGLLLKS